MLTTILMAVLAGAPAKAEATNVSTGRFYIVDGEGDYSCWVAARGSSGGPWVCWPIDAQDNIGAPTCRQGRQPETGVLRAGDSDFCGCLARVVGQLSGRTEAAPRTCDKAAQDRLLTRVLVSAFCHDNYGEQTAVILSVLPATADAFKRQCRPRLSRAVIIAPGSTRINSPIVTGDGNTVR